MFEFPRKKRNPGPCCHKEESGGSNSADSTDLNDMKSVFDIPDHCLKASTTMHGIITDPDQAERIRKRIKKLK